MRSIISFERPIPHNGMADWTAKAVAMQHTGIVRRDDAFNLRHQSRQLRNELRIKTEWDIYHNSNRLSDRVMELDRWRETLALCLDRVNSEMESLKQQKADTESDLEQLSNTQVPVIAECLSLRDGRFAAELTYDDADVEMKKEICVVENVKKEYIDRCTRAWEKINRLAELQFKLQTDINDKMESISIDRENLALHKDDANISFKPDSMRVKENAIPYETWLEHARYSKLLADNELADTAAMREALFMCREKSRNDLSAQQASTDFALRKRIFETQRARNELQYQSAETRSEMEKVATEITTLERAFNDATDSFKLCQTRLERRAYRPGFELARDEPEFGLQDEFRQLVQTKKDLQDKIDCAKATYNALENYLIKLNFALEAREHALMVDIRCMDARARLKSSEYAVNKPKPSQTQRNIVLSGLGDELPPE